MEMVDRGVVEVVEAWTVELVGEWVVEIDWRQLELQNRRRDGGI